MFSTGETRMIGWPYAEESVALPMALYKYVYDYDYDDMLSRIDTILERGRRTDGQNCYINVARLHCCADARLKWSSEKCLTIMTMMMMIIIIIIQMPMFMVLSSWQNHCESSPGSFDECRTAPSGRRPSDQAKWVGLRVDL